LLPFIATFLPLSTIHLDTGLKELGFQQSKIDECLYYRGRTLFLVYIDNGIMMDLNQEAVEQVMKDLGIQDEGAINNYLGVKVEPGRVPGTFVPSICLCLI
jgi:hypothetical protein